MATLRYIFENFKLVGLAILVLLSAQEMNRKAQTLIERLGFEDPDRKTPKHDEIQIWVYDNIEMILRSFLPVETKLVCNRKSLEYPIVQETQNFKQVVGFVDLSIGGTFQKPGSEQEQFFASLEIKPTITSCGDLIRQINFYRRFESFGTRWIVVSPDETFSRILNGQGIHFYKYSPPEIAPT